MLSSQVVPKNHIRAVMAEREADLLHRSLIVVGALQSPNRRGQFAPGEMAVVRLSIFAPKGMGTKMRGNAGKHQFQGIAPVSLAEDILLASRKHWDLARAAAFAMPLFDHHLQRAA